MSYMAKSHIHFICEKCGAAYPKWTGRCNACGEWNTLILKDEDGAGREAAVDRGRISGKKLETKRSDYRLVLKILMP